MEPVTALVTGGAGFIGSHLVDRLVGEGASVRVVDNFSTGRAENVNPGADMVEGDITDYDLMARLTEGVDVVFHLAAVGSVARSVENPLVSDRANTHGTLTVLKAAVEAKAGRVVFASSSSVYGGAAEAPALRRHRSCPARPMP
jgi:UDP-glucose 4-epimerase